MTKAELSRAAGVSVRTISSIEDGDGDPREETQYKLLNGLNDRHEPKLRIEQLFPRRKRKT